MSLPGSDRLGRLTRRQVVVGLGLAASGIAFTRMKVSAGGEPGSGSPSNGTAGTAVLESRPWKLVGYVGPSGSIQSVLPGTEVTATFRAGRVTGGSGCNMYTGAYQASGTSISLSPIAGTRRMCASPPGIMEQEAAYLAALGRANQFDAMSDTLVLRDSAGGILLNFVPQPQTPLEGTTWTAQDYNNGRGGVVSLVIGTEVTARFQGGRVAGSAGCNSYTAPYSLNGNAIEIGRGASTQMACLEPPGIMEQEAAYLTALETARVYRIEGSRLILQTAAGARVASFVPRPEAPPR